MRKSIEKRQSASILNTSPILGKKNKPPSQVMALANILDRFTNTWVYYWYI